MRITEKYIIMCEKAEELQTLWIPKIGDWYIPKIYLQDYQNYSELQMAIFIICNAETLEKIRQNKKDYIWLPRLDQLLHIITELYNKKGNSYNTFQMLDEIFNEAVENYDWCFWDLDPSWEYQLYTSAEEALLVYLMFKMHNKVWVHEKNNWYRVENLEMDKKSRKMDC